MRNAILPLALTALLINSCASPTELEISTFVTVSDGQLMRDNEPYNYIGANFWYGAILGSQGTGGNRTRLCAELDSMKALGIDNLRVLVGSDGATGVTSKVEPTLQTAPGVYNDSVLDGLDYLLFEMNKRNMLAVLYLNNSWEWSGGYGQYLEWAGMGKAPVPKETSWPVFMDYVSQFVNNDEAKKIFADYVDFIITRTNRYTGGKYTEDTTIMSWQIGNEPRAFSDKNKEAFALWIAQVAKQIKSLDSNHLVSTGSEGKHGCEQDISLYERIHSDKNIDYMNIHIWPYNWSWASPDSLTEHLQNAKDNTVKYVDEHLTLAKKYGKPVVLEEFGYPRDGFGFDKYESATTARDNYFTYVFELVSDTTGLYRNLAGCNFWAWGGMAEPQNVFWENGDDYTGDPAQEEQGLNSVFLSDKSTVNLIYNVNKKINKHFK